MKSKNFKGYIESAGNCNESSTRSSETTRETTLILSPTSPIKSSDWLEWFIGFTEGDGAILTTPSGCRFVLTQRDGEVLYHIKSVLGIGKVNYSEGNRCYRYIVKSHSEIIALFKIFNGNLVLDHRIKQLKRWYEILNSTSLNLNIRDNLNTKFLSGSKLLSMESAWLAGFTDAEGCFNVNIIKRKESVILRFILCQKNAEVVLLNIRSLIGHGYVTSEKNSINRYTVNTFIGAKSIISYFTRFTLKTSKVDSFNKWLEVAKMIDEGEHLNLEGVKKIRAIAVLINKKNSICRKVGSR